MGDTDLKGEHLQIKHIENERDETNMQRSKHNVVTLTFLETLQIMDKGWRVQTYKNTKTWQQTAQH